MGGSASPHIGGEPGQRTEEQHHGQDADQVGAGPAYSGCSSHPLGNCYPFPPGSLPFGQRLAS